MTNWETKIIHNEFTIRQALGLLDKLGIESNVIFVVDDSKILLGSITDGDIRRGLLRNGELDDSVTTVMNEGCKRVVNYHLDSAFIKMCRELGITYVPVVDDAQHIIDITNINEYREIVAAEAVIMAGGKGERLMPLTKDTPKPMLKVGNKPILEYNIDHLQKFGIRNIHITINYLGNQIQEYFKDGSARSLNIKYVQEDKPLGTIGSISLIPEFEEDYILLMNSDLLTNIDFGDFFKEFVKSGADMGVATIPHHVDLPYAILELQDSSVTSLKEKPRYTYFANAGIYFIKKELLQVIPKGSFYNATDLMEKLLQESKKLFHYPILGYWLDIGRINDFFKAQEDVKHIYW
ncbi:MAG: nucleotidyltransferase family protein [Chitinophagaceae bacterium]